MTTPKVVFDLTPLATRSRFRGIGTYTYDLGRALSAAAPTDMDLRFLVGRPGQYALWEPGWDADRDATIAACGRRPLPYQTYYLQKRTVMPRWLGERRVALVHAPDPKGTRSQGRFHTVVTAHDLIPTVLGRPYRWYPGWVSAGLDRARYGRHQHVVSISEHTALDLVNVGRVPRERITVVHHGVDHGRYHAGERELTEAPYFFYIGGFDARKQVRELIAAFGRIRGRVCEELWIAGEPSSEARGALERTARDEGVMGRVRIMGFVDGDALPALYRGATAHVLPTRYEGFGMTALEAMASGCPVITLRASCVPEICGDAAAYARPGDWEAWGELMVRVATEPGYRESLRAAGIERARRFTWARAAAETVDVYRRVLGL